MPAKDLLTRPYAAWLSYLRGDIDDEQMEEAVGHACDEIERLREALHGIAYSRPAGPLRNKLAEQYEKVARAALKKET